MYEISYKGNSQSTHYGRVCCSVGIGAAISTGASNHYQLQRRISGGLGSVD
jgi:hypothetical protein